MMERGMVLCRAYDIGSYPPELILPERSVQ
ncbi:hypothetical protein P3T31_000088 [Rhizobium sp. AN70]|nr:hypothetical protein [Rhizobium sp. AN70]